MFGPIQFTYTPPPTAATATLPTSAAGSPGASNTAPGTAPTAQTAADASRAAALLKTIQDLQATSQYLQQIILAQTSTLGIGLNFDGDPELGPALNRLYGTTTPPATITVAMYNNLLQTEYGIQRTDIVLANSNSTLEPSPYQRADCTKVTQLFEDALVSTGDSSTQLPLLLRELQGNDLFYDYLAAGIQQYPVLQGTSYVPPATVTQPPIANYNNPAATSAFDDFATLGTQVGSATLDPTSMAAAIDVSPGLSDNLNERLAMQGNIYGSMYNVAVGANVELTDIAQFALQDVDTIMALMSGMMALKALFHKPKLSDLKNSLTMLLLSRLSAELSSMTLLFDRLYQRVTAPIQKVLQDTSAMLAQLSGLEKNVAYMVCPGGLTSTIRSHIAKTPSVPPANTINQIDQLNQQLVKYGGYMAWGMNEVNAKAQSLQASLLAAYDRALQASGDRLDILKSLTELDQVLSSCKNLILQTRMQSSVLSQNAVGIGQAATSGPTLAQTLPGIGSAVADNATHISGAAATNAALAPLVTPPPAVSAVLVAGGASL